MNTLLKRFLVLLTVLALVFSMAACSPSEEPAEEPEQEEPAEEPEEEEPAEEPEEPAEVDEDVVAEAVNSYFAEMPEDIYKIGQADFIEKVANGEDMFVLDIRQADAYAEGHVLGAYNAPWGPAIAENLDKLPTDKTVYVYCYSGQTAGQAVATLNMAGIDAKSVNLGFNFGISKVEGYEDYIETYEYEFGEAVTEIDPSMQAALTAYYEGLADVAGTTYANYKISEMDLAKLRDAEDDSIYILSIRQQDAYDAGHIAGADLIPWGPGMEQEFDKLPMDKTIVVYCYSGQTAGQTVAGLRLLGYDAVSLNGGMGVGANAPLGWSNKGYPVHVVEEAALGYFENLPEDINKIGQADFLEKVAAEEDMFVLDIRQADAYAEGHVKGSVNAPWGPAIAENLNKIPQDKTVYVYCYSGQTAGQAVATLRVAGVDAKSVNLGFNFGISKVEGYEAHIETEAKEFGDATAEIAPAIQTAFDKYYNGLADVAGTTYANYKISEADLKGLIDAEDDSIYVLSIRQEDAYNEGHIPTAELMPFGQGMQENFNTLPRDKKVVVYCYSGQTAGQTVGILRLLGYDAVSLNGGVGVGANEPLGWANQGYELVQ
jgi:rhodanese-related sulfurtransferase